MGQRHQVFVVYPEDGEQKVVAFHHQWSYGSLPLRALKRIMQFQKMAPKKYTIGGEYAGHEGGVERIKAILSTSPSDGVYTNYLDITDELVSKKGVSLDGGDNNDGLTIIKVDGSRKVSYCFMSAYGIEGSGDKFEPLTPISAEDYMRNYYPSDKGYKKYGGTKLVPYIDKHAHLLTIKELRKIFPKFYKGKKLELETIQNSPRDELPLMLNPRYYHNKAFVEKRLKNK